MTMAPFYYSKHTEQVKLKKRKNEWGGQIVFSHGTSNSHGVAILFPPTLDYNILEKQSDNDGCFLLLKCKFGEAIYIIVNCYAPRQQYKNDQINFINFIKKEINNFENENIIMGGHFNFYMDPDLDKQKNMTGKDINPVFRQEIKALLETINLADSWRIQNSNARRYTWHSRGKSARLDFLFISENLLNDINKILIKTGLHSDHSIVNLELNSNKLNRGNAFLEI